MKVKTRTIYMLVAILIVMVASYLFDEWYRFNRNSQLLRQEHVSIVNKFFKGIFKRTTAILKAESGLILRDKTVSAAYQSGDRQALQKSLKPYMQYMKAVFPGSPITLNIYEPDGTVFLRAQAPKKFGDNPAHFRPILAAVVDNGKPVSGIELCSSTLSQRFVSPIIADGKMIGILEVSTDIGFVANRVSSISSIKNVVLLDSGAVNRMNKIPGVHFRADYLNNTSVPFDKIVGYLNGKKPYFKYNDTAYEVIKSFPLFSFNGSKAGTMYFISQTGGLESWFREHIIRALIICIVGVVLIVYVAGRGFIESIAELEKEHDEAVAGLKKMNSELEERVNHEVENCRKKDQIINQQQKVADMGMMLSALAHHWRQPINAVGLYVQDLSEAFRSGEITKEYIDEFERNNMGLLTKLSDSIDKYRTFFEPSVEKTSFEVTTVLSEISDVLSASLASSGVRLVISCKCAESAYECDLSENLPECDGKKTEITGFLNEFKQTLLNIVYNSMDAINQRYKSDPDSPRDGMIRVDMLVDDNDIVMNISDNGTGIAADVIDKVFNPFFTTKKDSSGTGIGLYMAKTVIEKYMCGSITAENNDRGATMHIVLHRNQPCI